MVAAQASLPKVFWKIIPFYFFKAQSNSPYLPGEKTSTQNSSKAFFEKEQLKNKSSLVLILLLHKKHNKSPLYPTWQAYL